MNEPFLAIAAPWLVLLAYCALVWMLSPRRVSPGQFFGGMSGGGAAPGLWMLVFSAAITWVFAKSIANAALLGQAFGWIGGVGYATYYLSFVVAAIAIYFIRTRGGHDSLASFLVSKYGTVCARLFLIAIGIRLFNEVWSNTKVGALYFGGEGSAEYWIAALAITAFTAYYSWVGGVRSSLLTDAGQMFLAAILLTAVLLYVIPPLVENGIPPVSDEISIAGITFLALAAVQVLSYPFHDPVMTDRAFLTKPKTMVKAFLLAGLISGSFIMLFSFVGVFARANGIEGPATVSVPAAFGLPLLLIFNAIMLTSAGSTLDSTFSSSAKLVAVDWFNRRGTPEERQKRIGRLALVTIAIFGNAPLLSIYLGDQAGPAIIAATTISGTMVMGLAPIFLLSFLKGSGPVSFHLAFWPGLIFGIIKTIESATGSPIFPDVLNIGGGKYADDLGINIYGLMVCTTGYLIGALAFGRKSSPATAAASRTP